MKRRLISVILVLAMIFGCFPMAFATENSSEAVTPGAGPLSLTANAEHNGESSLAPEKTEEPEPTQEAESSGNGLPKYEQDRTPFSQNDAATVYAADDMVTFIVVMEQQPLLDKFLPGDIAKLTPGVKAHQDTQLEAIQAIQSQVITDLGNEEGFKMGYTYTIASTGFSVTTAYGNREKLAAMEGVERVYVAPVYSLPQDQGAQPYTNNASTMIGADVLNATGFTGKGMRIAILDTGIKLDHPSFAALSDDQLEDPLTAEAVEAIWKDLNAGQSTPLLNLSYYNTKIPYAFNYNASNFNVDNTYAYSDHGTHVAGIAAANKLDSTTVVGVAPEAQLVVMQVFSPDGGASWDVILAALEDCVRLEVDSVNLSLGAAAGFTDPEGDMLEVMKRFQDSDILLLIAAGNDTNSAYGNAWGYNMSLITNPDTGLTSTPSTYSAAISIASIENDGFEQLYITVNGKDLGYQDTAFTSYTNFLANYRSQELEYVFVPGLGAAEDYEGYDVTGKVAVVSRGDLSFQEKQLNAQEAGAIACIVYDNAYGVINMQVYDGEGYIPCISVSKASGAYLEEQYNLGNTTLTVCDADTQLFKVDRALSDFSTWGVTPDLKLKPELSGVGGNIYSATHSEISGTNYGTMSGTSMATPQITGAMAVLKQYINETYPELSGTEVRQLATNLLMSTAIPVMATDELEVSPRGQGAGVADLVNATTSPAYISNPAADEGRPKAELGDNDSKSGVFTFSFQIHNLTADALVYDLSSSILTEEIAYGAFIAGRPYGLEAEVEFDAAQVTVPGNGCVTVNATLTLTDNDKTYLNQFPNGIYVEGFVYATPADNAEGLEPVKLVMPLVGFYGDWSDAPIFDGEDDYSQYPLAVYTNFSQVGHNPYIRSGRSGEEYNAFSYANPLAELDVGMLRNAKKVVISAANAEDGTEYFSIEGSDITKSYYYAGYGMIIPFYILTEEGEFWNGLDADGNKLPDGTTATVRVDAWLDDGDDIQDDAIVFDVTLDNQAPQLLNANDLQDALRYDEATGHLFLKLELLDNLHIAAALFESPNGDIMSKQEIINVPGETLETEIDITSFGDEFTIILGDFACNEVSYDVILDLTEFDMGSGGQAQPLDKDRIYGSETYGQAGVEAGWFSANKADLSGLRNETYDTSNLYYAAEYVNGYLIGQNAGTGNLEFITPAGTYWSTKELISQYGNQAGDPGTWVLYDMAIDHSGSYKEMLDPYNYKLAGTDALFAIGWNYQGDNNNDGHDDGSNVLYLVCLQASGYNYMENLGTIQGVNPGFELVTFGITTEGKMYGIGTDGYLYSIALEGDGWGGVASVNATPIGDTKFSQLSGGNPNVIQSMGYDHNTGTMYWFAHNQTQVGYVYEHYNMTYIVDLETAELTEVGTYGPGGQTALFIPNDLQSDLFTLGVNPTGFSFGNIWEMTLVEGASRKLDLTWNPWNCTPGTVTWSSDDETIATVDQTGKITAHNKGETYIKAVGQVWDAWANYNYDTGSYEGGWVERTQSVSLTVVESQDEIYAFIVSDYVNSDNQCTWVTYSDTDLKNVTQLNKPMVTIEDPMSGETITTDAIWQGGAYYNGYVYTVMAQTRVGESGGFGGATVLYRTKVTQGATPAETVFGEPEEIGYTMGIEVGNMGFDYNTGRMYGVDLTTGGLCIVDLDTGAVDSLGEFTGDIGGAAIATAMTVTADGTIIIADMESTLYTVDPDTMSTKRLGSVEGDSWYYAGMGYDYNTGNIYWNPCHNSGQCPFYMVMLEVDEWDPSWVTAKIIDMGDVSTKEGVEQCVIFTIPENEPETNHIPVESITIDQGDAIVGLQGGYTQLTATTEPLRPTVQTRTWTSSDESVVTVDRAGNLEYVGVGTATITVSITNKDEATQGGPFTDSIEITVLEAAGEFVAFLAEDSMGTSWYDYWLSMNDYDLRHASPIESAISIYSINAGTYFDGFYYGYDKEGNFLRINAENVMDYKVLGNCGLNYDLDKVDAMAFDYTTGTMYGITHRSNYSYVDWTSMEQPGRLVTIDLATGALTEVAVLDFNTPVYALACDENGILYAVGSNSMWEGTAHLYTLDKETGALSLYTDIPGCSIYSGPNYYGPGYNPTMTYDFASKRLYINATTIDHSASGGGYSGVIMVQLGQEEPTIANLGGISIYARQGASIKKGLVYLGLMAFIPEADDLPECPVVGVQVSKTTATTYVGGVANVEARVQPMNVSNPTLVWISADESIATVDGNGSILGMGVGTTTVTVASQMDPTKLAVITVNVIDASGAASLAYTASENAGGIVAFDPALPSQTAHKVFDFDGANNIKGLAMGDGFMYYVLESGYYFELYRFDLTTGLSTYMGSLETFGTMDAIAYDSVNNILYGVGGFYLFQYNMDKANYADPNYYSNYMMDGDYCTLAGVACVDGAVYTIGTSLWDNNVQLMRYSDKYLSDRTVINYNVSVNTSGGATEMHYDARSNQFYISDAGHNLYAMDLEGNCQYVDVVGNGIDLHGIAITSADHYRVTYTDGVEDEEVFADQTILVKAGDKTPAMAEPVREGYAFAGWNPEVSETVTGHAAYEATWIRDYGIKFSSISTSLGGDIAMNFYVEIPVEVMNNPNAAMKFTYAGREVIVPLSEGVVSVKNGVTRYRYSCPIASKFMADTITAQVIDETGAISKSKSMSVRSYCDWIIANYSDEATVNLMKAMLNYGASAQVLFDYNVEDLANVNLAEADKVLTAADASAFAHSRSGSEDGIKPVSYTLLLDSETTIRVYFQLTGDKTIDEYTFAVDGETVTPVEKDGRYYIELRNIAAHKLDVMHTFTCGGITIRYSALSYVNQVMTAYNSGATYDMACALFAYWQAAENYIK